MRRLYVVRPEPGASATVCEAAGLGLEAVAMPLFSVVPLEWQIPGPAAFDALLLTSANALRHGGAGLDRLRNLPVHAVGGATAKAARDMGFAVASTGDSGVQQLLERLDPHLRLLHLCGKHRMTAPEGRRITSIPVYESAPLPAPAGLGSIAGHTVAIHSSRAAQRLGELAAQEQIDRSTVRIAAISTSAARSAGEGWEVCEAADHPDSTSLLALAARLCDKPRQP